LPERKGATFLPGTRRKKNGEYGGSGKNSSTKGVVFRPKTLCAERFNGRPIAPRGRRRLHAKKAFAVTRMQYSTIRGKKKKR